MSLFSQFRDLAPQNYRRFCRSLVPWIFVSIPHTLGVLWRCLRDCLWKGWVCLLLQLEWFQFYLFFSTEHLSFHPFFFLSSLWNIPFSTPCYSDKLASTQTWFLNSGGMPSQWSFSEYKRQRVGVEWGNCPPFPFLVAPFRSHTLRVWLRMQPSTWEVTRWISDRFWSLN